MANVVQLLDLPLHEALALARSGAPAWIFVNPVEYHGPHLPLHTDELISTGIARMVHDAVFPEHPFLVAGRLEMGVEPVPGPGTRAFSYREVRDAVLSASRAVAGMGFQRVGFGTFHGAPLHNRALDAGVQHLRARGVRAMSLMNCVFEGLLDYDLDAHRPAYAHVTDEALREELLATLPEDFHAGTFETSLVMHFAPGCVGGVDLPPCPPIRPVAPLMLLSRLAARLGLRDLGIELRFAAWGLGWYATRPFYGYTTRPSLATPEAGAVFARLMQERFVPRARGVYFEGAPPPRPILAWTAWPTLFGALGGGHPVALPPPAR